jgi:16S rRNA (uracil1498-N3)-methyltransferase
LSVPRLYVPELSTERVELDVDTVRRLKKVLRLRGGDRLVLFDGLGLEADALLEEGGRAATVLTKRQVTESGPSIHLYPALARANRFDWVVEKAALAAGCHRGRRAEQPQAVARDQCTATLRSCIGGCW